MINTHKQLNNIQLNFRLHKSFQFAEFKIYKLMQDQQKKQIEIFQNCEDVTENRKDKISSMCSIQEELHPELSFLHPKAFLSSDISTSQGYFNSVAGFDCFFNDDKSKSKNNRRHQLDRYVPNRKGSKLNLQLNIAQIQQQNEQNKSNRKCQQSQFLSMADIYKKHILGVNLQVLKQNSTFTNRNKLKFSQKHISSQNLLGSSKSLLNIKEQITNSIVPPNRKIPKTPFKILDAPGIEDDYYLNLIDWSLGNILSVALADSLYLWDASNNRVRKLVQLEDTIKITSNAWAPNINNILSFGNQLGKVQIWDVQKSKMIRRYNHHTERVGVIAWNNQDYFSTGSRDKTILNHDLRDPKEYTQKLIGHKRQICGLKWSFDHQQLASGGNDNKLLIWNNYSNLPILNLNKHIAAVKALAWSPHQHGLLVSGGGTADKKIRFWNTLTGQCTKVIDGKSQICNLMFSKTVNQLVSTHGHPNNQINIWKVPQMQKLATLNGHSFRVLYLAMNPNGNAIATGSGDETLRFWNIFPSKEQQQQVKQRSELLSQLTCLR